MAYTRFAKSSRDGTIDPSTGAVIMDIAPVADPDQFDPRGNQIGVSTVTKKFNEPQQAEDLKNPAPASVLKYPADENYPAYILFRVKKINPWDIDFDNAASLLDAPALTGEKGLFNRVRNIINSSPESTQQNYEREAFGTSSVAGASEAQAQAESAKQREAAKAAEQAASKKDILGVTHRYVNDLPAIKLYMPQAINIMDQVQYNNASLGPSGAAGLAAVNAGNSFMSGARAFFDDALGFIGDALSASGTRNDLSRLALNRAVQATPTGSQANAAASIGFQVTVNPNTRVLFEGVTIREFAFTFDFMPVSKEEAETVNQIVKFFRTELYPSTIGRKEGVPIGYNFPHVFEIKFRVGQKNAPMPQPHLCYLRNVQSSFNPGSMSFHADGNPTHTQLTLNFTEFRTLSKEDIEEGR